MFQKHTVEIFFSPYERSKTKTYDNFENLWKVKYMKTTRKTSHQPFIVACKESHDYEERKEKKKSLIVHPSRQGTR